jgi:hypothetical protein
MTANPVSNVTGRRQGPALRAISIVAWMMAGVGVMGDTPWSMVAGVISVGLITATPLLRVAWLMFRWLQEQDWRFVWTAAALLVVIALGGLFVLVGR